MINVAVYGTSKYSILMKQLLENEYSNVVLSESNECINVNYFISENHPSSDNEITLNDFANRYHAGELSAIIIPKEYYIGYNVIIQQLIKLEINIDDVYNGSRLNHKDNKPYGSIEFLITSYLQDSYLSYLEYHVADHCNLNCKYCTHYSPLVDKPVFTDLNSFIKDISRLKEYINDIGIIRVLGGEPLLNPELPKFLEITRNLYPNTIIYIVTNGLLLDKISQELIDTMKKNMIFFHISFYKPMREKITQIKEFLVKNEIPFNITEEISQFNKTQKENPSDNLDFFYSCTQATCTCIHEGKISPCYAPFTTKYFNERFNKNLPINEGIDLFNDENTTESIKLSLLYPLERCAYCVTGPLYDWEIVGKNSSLKDWVE